ncbi:hypothetical protein CR513_01806, partial [Mucuna pruriens]
MSPSHPLLVAYKTMMGSMLFLELKLKWRKTMQLFPHWSFDFGSTLDEGHTNTLDDNAFNWECSMCEMGSIQFYTMEPNNQQFETPNLHIVLEPRYESFQYGFGRNTLPKVQNAESSLIF